MCQRSRRQGFNPWEYGLEDTTAFLIILLLNILFTVK